MSSPVSPTRPSLAELTVRDLTERLASRAPTPGGGSASALGGALAAALVEMVCELTAGRPGYDAVDPIARQIGTAAGELRVSLLEAAEEDAAAYDRVADARRLSRETDEAQAESTELQISTIADTWIHLSYQVRSGERNRALTIIKRIPYHK